MIEMIKIKNYALIEDSEIELGPGLNIITGETGAGKSLFINALSLIMGEKVSAEVIGKNGSESIIEAIVKQNNILTKKLKEIEIDTTDSIVIKRVIGSKNRCYVNGNLISLSQLKTLMSGFLEICSQNENISILESNYQMDVIDKYSIIDKELGELKDIYFSLKKEQNNLVDLENKQKSILEKKDYLEFQLNEILSFQITKDDEKIDTIISQLKNDLKIKELESTLKNNLYSTNGVKGLLKESSFLLKELDSILDKKTYEEFKKRTDDFIAYLDKINFSSVSIDEEEINYYLSRNEELSKIKRKHGSILQILEKKEELNNQLASIDNFDQELNKIKEQIQILEKKYNNLAKKISQRRKESAIDLSKIIENNLKDLNMPFAKFKIEVIDTDVFSEKGKNQINFLISPNRSEDLSLIEKIASGGELSRIVLSVYNSFYQKNKCLLFDEVDSGIGGDTAHKIGQKLKEISQNSQTICITHLPQVAVFGLDNFKIDKVQEKTKTTSKIYKLDPESLEKEVARMLGLSLSGNKALDNAREMIKKAKNN